MKTTIDELMLQIISTTLLIQQQGKWHVFVYMYGNASHLAINVCSAETDYNTPGYPAQHREAYWHRLPFEWHPEDQAQQACHDEMTSTLAWLQGYLDMPATTAQEAAA